MKIEEGDTLVTEMKIRAEVCEGLVTKRKKRDQRMRVVVEDGRERKQKKLQRENED